MPIIYRKSGESKRLEKWQDWGKQKLGLLIGAGVFWAGSHDGLVRATPFCVPVTFAITTNTVYGQSVFVIGSIPQLGNWAPTNAVKMLPAGCSGSNCTWALNLGIPEGTYYEYKFVKRLDCATCLGESTNIVWMDSGTNRTGSTPAGPTAPFNGKSVFYYSGWTNPSIIYANSSGTFTSKVMTAFANGRTAGEKIWRADGINVAGQTNLLFVFSDNNGHYDNPDGVSGQNYSTPLDAFVVQDGQVFNYWPAPAIAAPWVESFSLAPTNGLQTRPIRVYLPRGFTNNLAKRYPVLYMNDGQNLFLGQGNFGGWNADTNATFLIRSGRMRELIIVGVDNTSDRTCEYNPCNLGSCGASNSLAPRYMDFIINQLKPFIDAQYPTTAGRTLTDPDNTGIVGSSRGGLCAVSMYNAKAFAALTQTSPLAPFNFQRRDPGAHDVQIEILYCGVCHTDVHIARNEWHGTTYPCVPGHEIVGRVVKVGAHVKKFKEGDLAGVGCMVDSCRTCENCQDDLEQFCVKGATFTYNAPDKISGGMTNGGYSDSVVVDESFVLKMPKHLDLAASAPLLCAGITTYSPLRHHKVTKGQKVGVIGLGGLGHMGVKLAKAFGAHVVVFTTSANKVADALRLGADEVVNSKNPGEMAAQANSFHFLLDTVAAQHDINSYFALLKRDGTLTQVGVPAEPLAIQASSLIFGRKNFDGSLIGGIRETQEMLDFCGEHNITSDIELIPIQKINEAYERLIKSDVKYRFVIDMASLK